MNLPALVKTSHQPSFGSANFSPFTSAEALRSSDISPVPSLNLQRNPRGGTAKKITSSPYKKIAEATHKMKNKQAKKSETNRLASNALLGPLRRWKRRVCWDPSPSDTQSHSDTDLAVLLVDDSAEEDEEQDADCVYSTGRFVSLQTTMEKTGYDVQNVSDGRPHCVLVWREILFANLVRDKHCFVLSLYPLYL